MTKPSLSPEQLEEVQEFLQFAATFRVKLLPAGNVIRIIYPDTCRNSRELIKNRVRELKAPLITYLTKRLYT